MPKQPAIYILANKRNGTLYTGVTSDLVKRVWQHKQGLPKNSFTSRYDCKMLVYYELCDEMIVAIEREKQIKAGSRKDKINLVITINPNWLDLYDHIIG